MIRKVQMHIVVAHKHPKLGPQIQEELQRDALEHLQHTHTHTHTHTPLCKLPYKSIFDSEYAKFVAYNCCCKIALPHTKNIVHFINSSTASLMHL
jgi:hypothetical protein